MDVKTVCLGLLTFGEATGYDLKKHFEAGFEHFFATGFGSIYPALASLADEGMVTCTEVPPQEGKPGRKIYRITSRGEQFLEQTLDETRPAHKMRSEFLAMMYFAHLLYPAKLRSVLDQKIADFEAALAYIDHPVCPEEHKWPASVRFVSGFGKAVLSAGRDYLRANRHLVEEGDGQPRPDETREPRAANDASVKAPRTASAKAWKAL
jgi:PadR family transcriptional regulator AphA